MADPGRGQAKPLAWWGIIQGAVRERATTAEIWAAIRDFGERNNLAYPPTMFQDVNRIRGQAASLRNSSERLARAAPSDALTSRLLSPLPYARSSVEQALAREFHVRVNYTGRAGDEVAQSYITLAYSGNQLPATVGSLYQDVNAVTAATVSSYNGELISVDSIEIGEW